MKLCGKARVPTVVVCLALLPVFTAEDDDSTTKPKERFYCGVDICNVGEQDQYCDQNYRRCHDCSFKQSECYLPTMPSNCSMFCIEMGVKLALEKVKEKPCGPLNMVAHGHHNVSMNMEHTIGTVVQTSCEVGTLEGVDTTQCMEFGVWSNPLPVCRYDDSILVAVLIVVSFCLVVSCSFNVIQWCLAISKCRKYKAYVTVDPTNKDKAGVCDVGVNTKSELDSKLNESEIQASVMEVDETNLTVSSPNLQAAALPPRAPQELVPSAPSENDNIKSGPRDQGHFPLSEITTIGKNDLPFAPNTLAAPSNSGESSSPLHPDGSNVTQGQGNVTIHVGNVVINQSTGDNNTINGIIGDNPDRKKVPRRIRRLSNRTKDEKDESECSHPIEESGETKLPVQPVDQDENNETKVLLPQTVSSNGYDDDSDDEVDDCPKYSLRNDMANQLKKPCVRE